MNTLVLIDLQRDFLPGGALGIPRADSLVPLVNQLMKKADRVIATMDWHPRNHVSFAETHGKKIGETIAVHGAAQILWPVHCVQNTLGASLAEGLEQEGIHKIFYKGTDPDIDSYSAFFDAQRKKATGLADYLIERKIKELYFAGVATDYCVLYTVLDALELGFSAWVLQDACRAVNLHPDDEAKALCKMQQCGAHLVRSAEFLL